MAKCTSILVPKVMAYQHKEFTALPSSLLADDGISTTDIRLFLLLCSNTFETDIDVGETNIACSDNNQVLAQALSVTQMTIRSSLKKLSDLGYISIIYTGRHRLIFPTKISPEKISEKKFKNKNNIIYNIIYNKKHIPFRNMFLTISIDFDNPSDFNISTEEKKFELIPVDEMSIDEQKFIVTEENEIPESLLPDERPKRVRFERASVLARRLVYHWNSLSEMTTHKTTTKLIEKTLWLLDKKLLDKYGYSTIKRSMSQFNDMCKHKNLYKGLPNGKYGIYDFFVGNRYAARRTGKKPFSWFEALLEPDSYRRFQRMKDCYPEVTLLLKELYKRHVLVEDHVMFSPKQEADFVRASAMLKQYMRKRRLEKYIVGATTKDYILRMLEALAAEFGASNITTGNLCSEYTYNSILPRYLSRNFEG